MNQISLLHTMLRRGSTANTDNPNWRRFVLAGSRPTDAHLNRWKRPVAKSLALLIGMSAVSAHAGEHNWYAGIDAGQSDIYNPRICVAPCGDLADDAGNSNAWGLNVGYRFNAHLALEYGYHRIFDENLSVLKPEVSTHDVSLLAYTPEFRRVSVFARMGLSRMHDDPGTLIVLPDRDSTEAHFGLGANWRAGERVNLTIERVEYADTYFSRGHVLRFGLGFAF